MTERTPPRTPETEAELRRLKLEVLSRIAHDVRAPLSVVLTGLKELRETQPAFDDYQKSVFKLVCSSAETSLQLLKDLHDLARIEERCLPLQKVEVDLAGIARSVAGSATAKASEKAPALDVLVPNSPVRAVVDEARFAQAIGAIVENAMRVAKGKVVLSLADDAGKARVLVDDDGPGVPTQDMSAIFDSGAHKAVRPGGTGLGLAVAKGLVEAHGGSLWVENRTAADGRVEGARFVVELAKS